MKRSFTILVLIWIFVPLTFANTYRDGLDAYATNDFEKALRLLVPFAEGGDQEAQYSIARMYNQGYGVVKNKKLALKWFIASAKQGHPIAKSILTTSEKCTFQSGKYDCPFSLEKKTPAKTNQNFQVLEIEIKKSARQKRNEAFSKKIEEDRKKREEATEKYPIKIGMLDWQLRAVKGYPKKINKTTNAYGVREQWVYGSLGNPEYYYFSDGVLSSIQN